MASVIKTIDEIKKIRKNNNHNWMSILEIAVKHAPMKTLPHLKSILNNDYDINCRLRQLIEELEENIPQ